MPDTPPIDAAPPRLYLDCHVNLQLAKDLTARGVDVLTSQAANRITASDAEQLEFAAQGERALVTFNIRDFAPLHLQWLQVGRVHSGIIVSQQIEGRRYRILLDRMLRLLAALTRDDLRGALVHLEQFR